MILSWERFNVRAEARLQKSQLTLTLPAPLIQRQHLLDKLPLRDFFGLSTPTCPNSETLLILKYTTDYGEKPNNYVVKRGA